MQSFWFSVRFEQKFSACILYYFFIITVLANINPDLTSKDDYHIVSLPTEVTFLMNNSASKW